MPLNLTPRFMISEILTNLGVARYHISVIYKTIDYTKRSLELYLEATFGSRHRDESQAFRAERNSGL